MYTRKKIILSFAGMFFLLLFMMSASLFFGSVLFKMTGLLSQVCYFFISEFHGCLVPLLPAWVYPAPELSYRLL